MAATRLGNGIMESIHSSPPSLPSSTDPLGFLEEEVAKDCRKDSGRPFFATKSRTKWKFQAVFFGLFVLTSILTVLAWSYATQDNDLQIVRAYLQENLDNPGWEEVRWWPARTSSFGRLRRLKFRERIGESSYLMHDEIFVIEDGEVQQLPDHRKDVQFYIWRHSSQYKEPDKSNVQNQKPEAVELPFWGAMRRLAGGGK